MKHTFVFLILMQFASLIYAQQQTYLSHYAFNKAMFNPAFCGENGAYAVNVFHHQQWLQLKDETGLFPTLTQKADAANFPTSIRPVAQGFGFAAPIAFCKNGDKQEYGGLFLGSYSDELAYEKSFHTLLGAAFAIRLQNLGKLRLGLQGDFQSRTIKTQYLRPLDPNDPLIPSGLNPTDNKMLMGAGLAYTSVGKHKFYSGINLSSFNQPEFQYTNAAGVPIYFKSARHFYATMGYEYGLKKIRNAKAIATAYLRTANAGKGWVLPQIEMQYHIQYLNQFSMGTGFRWQANGADAFSFLLGFYPNLGLKTGQSSLRIGYAFDKTLQSLHSSSRNTHEIQINYSFTRDCRLQRVRHPRDLKFFNQNL